MRRSAALLAFFVVQGVATATWAIDRDRSLQQMHHTSWTPREGAPTSVQEMAQTDDGFLWFATNSGLLRFDGVQFERYVPATGEVLPSASIRTLLALPGNGLIIGWFFGGATLLRDGRAIRYGEREGYPPGSTYGFVTDGEGRLWAATSNALARFDGERWHRVGADWNFGGQSAVAIFVDRAGTLGAFTDRTLMTLPKGATSFRSTGGTLTTRSPVVQSPDGTYFLVDARGIRSIASLERYDRVDRPWIVKTTKYDASRIIVDRDGSLWFNNSNGVGRVAYPGRNDPAVEYFSKGDGLSDLVANTVFEDREGSIWVATGGGVDRFRVPIFVPPTGKLRGHIPAMAPTSEGGLLFAEYLEKLHELTPRGVVRDVGPLHISCAYTDPAGVTWYGSKPSVEGKPELLRHARGRLERIALPVEVAPFEDVQAIAMDVSPSLWVSVVRRGVYRRIGNEWVKPPELPDAGKLTAIVLTADATGDVWLGYVGDRIARWRNGSVSFFSAAHGLSVGNVLAIHRKGSHVWVGGQRGLALFDSDRFRSMTVAEPEVMRGVTGIAETEEGDLWIHGNAGAMYVKAAEVRRAIDQPGHRMAFRLFDHEDGLSGTPTEIRPLPTLVAGTDGRLWFATNRGAFALDPKRMPASSAPPTVIIKAVIAGNARHASPVNVDFPALTTAVQVDYTATNLATPLRTRFRYKLAGVDPDWQEAGARRQAFYTNLRPGSYRFQVIAANEDGVWNTAGAGFEFAIAPAWYQTRWFAALCVLVALAFVVLAFNLRLRQVRAQIQVRLEERLMERERIARELHDTLLQSVQGLILHFKAAAARFPPGDASRASVDAALERANDVVAEGRDRVLDLRIAGGQDDLRTVLQGVADAAGLDPGIGVRVAVEGEARSLHPLVLAEIRQIASEALFNIARHAQAKSVDVTATFSPRELRIRIRDDGVGIDERLFSGGHKPGHFGLVGMRERAERIGAALTIDTRPAAGCAVTLVVPAKVAFSD